MTSIFFNMCFLLRANPGNFPHNLLEFSKEGTDPRKIKKGFLPIGKVSQNCVRVLSLVAADQKPHCLSSQRIAFLTHGPEWESHPQFSQCPMSLPVPL